MGKEVGDSISFKVWDYDKAGGNDLLGECVLDGSQFHKPGRKVEGRLRAQHCTRFVGVQGFQLERFSSLNEKINLTIVSRTI